MKFSEIKQILENFEDDNLVCYLDNIDGISIMNRDDYFVVKNFYNSFPDTYETENQALEAVANFLYSMYNLDYLFSNITIYDDRLAEMLNNKVEEE